MQVSREMGVHMNPLEPLSDEGNCVSWWLWGLVAPGLGQLKHDTTRVTVAARHPSPQSAVALDS